MSWELNAFTNELFVVICNGGDRHGVSGEEGVISSWNSQMHRGPPLWGFPGAGKRGCGSLQEECGRVAPQPSQTWSLEACSGALLTVKWSWAGHLAKSLSFLIHEVGIAARQGGKGRAGQV